MLFEHRYAGATAVRQDDAATAMSFKPDTLREPTYFRGTVAKQLEFREAISALHDVVTSDLRFVPKDRTAYMTWRAQQGYVDLADAMSNQAKLATEIKQLTEELSRLESASSHRRAPFYTARQKYFNYLYERDKELWFKLDPVITVHPDQVFFECFSRDESSYGRLAASYEVFDQLGDRANGTTNIDYSEKLYGEFQKIRSYKTTSLDVDPTGFTTHTSLEDAHREVKIDLPDSWVRGFLQVSAAATLPASVVDLHPMDVHNLCFVLRRNKELFGPRSLKFKLVPGAPVEVVVEPWNFTVKCPRSMVTTGSECEIRMWGRRRLFILERLLPRAKRVRLFLLGSGMPTFWVVDLGHLSFTLGLSGWTNNNWSEAGNFDLMAAREDVDDITRQRVFAELGKTWLATPEDLAARTNLATSTVASALAGWVQAGRAIFDLDRGVYRKRELTRTPLPIDRLRFANDREQRAAEMLHRWKIAVDRADTSNGLDLEGRLRDRGKIFATSLTFDADRRLVAGECSCDFFIRNRLHKGPCEHMLALRAAHRRGINDPLAFTAAPIPTDPSDRAAVIHARAIATEMRETFQVAYRKAVLRAAELRSAGRTADSLRELERIALLAPTDSDEWARVHEVIAEGRLDAGQHLAAKDAADRALGRFPTSSLALRVKRDALVALDDVPAAIAVARALAAADDKADRWEELLRLCDRAQDWSAMLAFAEEALRRHPRDPKAQGFTIARDTARSKGVKASTAAASPDAPPASPSSAADAPSGDPDDSAAKPSWWRRAVGAITGRPASQPPSNTSATPVEPTRPVEPTKPATVDDQLHAIADELAKLTTVSNREALIAVLRVAHAMGSGDARVTGMATAIKTCGVVGPIPSDQDLLALLRRCVP